MAFLGRQAKIPLGIYIHVPFCRSKCQYCDFYSLTEQEDALLDGYLDAVCQHIREAGVLAEQYQVDTVYFGGGTPSFFGAEGLAAILATVRKNFRVAADAEITFEANPDSVDKKLLRRLRGEGFTRVSLGIQSDDDRMLRRLGRPHTYQQAADAVKTMRKMGFHNVSVDLMYGLPGQSLEAWQKTLAHVLMLRPEHISCYGLKIEEGTPLYAFRDSPDLPDDDLQADMYLSAVEILQQHGYRQYEISNFCKKGTISRHNMKYWQGGEYLGFGPNASSYFAGKRFTTVPDLQAYISGIESGEPVLQQVQDIPPRERAGEYLMMRLRTTAGIGAAEYERQFLLPFAPIERTLEECKERGYAVKTYDGRWHLTPTGFLLSNSIISDLLLLQEKSKPITKRRR